eukprot:sb/3478500/
MSSNLYNHPVLNICDNDFTTYGETNDTPDEQGTITIDYGSDNIEFVSTSVVLMNKESIDFAELGWAQYMEGCVPIVLDSSGHVVGSCEEMSGVNHDFGTI